MDNTPAEEQIFQKEQTTYYMNEVLTGVTERGTATRARIDGIDTAGKTGTTNSNRDRWFCGYTPYYVGATWFGYDEDYNLSGVSGNPSVTLWTAVMKRIHEDLPNAELDMGENSSFTTTSYCTNTGLKPNGSCPTASGRFYKGDEPKTICSTCRTITLCKDSGKLWQEGICPEESRETKVMMDMTRYFPTYVSINDAGECFTGSNAPYVVENGQVMVSGGYQDACDFIHIVLPILPPEIDPELAGDGTLVEGEEIPSGPIDPEINNSGFSEIGAEIMDTLHNIFTQP